MEFHTPHAVVVSTVRPDSSGRILRFTLTPTLIPARFPSQSGGNLKEGEKTEPNPHSVPLAKRGEPYGGGQRPNPYPARFPSRSGGNLKEGGNYELWLGDWY